MSATPITFEQYAAFARDDNRAVPAPAEFDWDEAETTLPVVGVAWQDGADYADWLGELIGASCRLPSEAQWEYACRAGAETRYWWGDDFDPTMANTSEGGPGRPTPVGTFPPTANDWGLYDMSGNVWEWVLDHYHNTYDGAPIDGSARIDDGDQDNSPRVLRGGSWVYYRDGARCANRGRGDPDSRVRRHRFSCCVLVPILTADRWRALREQRRIGFFTAAEPRPDDARPGGWPGRRACGGASPSCRHAPRGGSSRGCWHRVRRS